MQRRLFIFGVAYSLFSPFALAQQETAPAKTDNKRCSDAGDTPANSDLENPDLDMDKNYPLPKLTHYKDFNLNLDYVNSFGHSWSKFPGTTRRLKRAVQLMNVVWSSVEFKNAVSNVTWPLQWKHLDDGTSGQIKGVDLYNHLMSDPNPTVEVTIVFGIAEAASAGRRISYRTPAVKTSSVYGLCNTTSHEYTHLDMAGVSTDDDYGTLPDASLFVSYGIGGLTEELASGMKRLYSCDLYPWPQAKDAPIITAPKP